MSAGDKPSAETLFGSSQIRRLYSLHQTSVPRPTPFNPCELIFNVQRRIVRQTQHVITVIRWQQMHHHGEVWRWFSVTMPRRCTSCGRRHSAIDLALYFGLRPVYIRANGKGDGQGHASIDVALRWHVQHVFDAVDFLLQRRSHGFGNHFRVSAWIVSGHYDCGRHNSGYSVIGSCQTAIAPVIKNSREYGCKYRSFNKNCDNMVFYSLTAASRFDRLRRQSILVLSRINWAWRNASSLSLSTISTICRINLHLRRTRCTYRWRRSYLRPSNLGSRYAVLGLFFA